MEVEDNLGTLEEMGVGTRMEAALPLDTPCDAGRPWDMTCEVGAELLDQDQEEV